MNRIERFVQRSREPTLKLPVKRDRIMSLIREFIIALWGLVEVPSLLMALVNKLPCRSDILDEVCPTRWAKRVSGGKEALALEEGEKNR